MLLTADERALLHSVRDFMTKEVDPIITNHWARATFASRSFPDFAGWASRAFRMRGTGCPGGRHLLDGMVGMELASVDPSIATFRGVHSGLAMGSIYLCGSEEQKRR
jgi:glutaryl-CoA dehydrogenase